MDVQTAAFIAGIVFGSIAVGSSSYVWVRHRLFGFGGAVLSLVGIALLGLSIWSGIRIEISDKGLAAEFKRLRQQLNDVDQQVGAVIDANEQIGQEAKQLAKTLETQSRQFVQLT